MPTNRVVVLLLVAPMLHACASDPREVFEVLVWVDGQVSEQDLFPRGDVYEGPCGPMRLLKVPHLRALSPDETAGLERVLEFAEDGEILAEWRMPVESYVTGIDAEWLSVSSSGGRVSINRNGDIRRADDAETEPQPEYFGDCPATVLTEFLGPAGQSDYLACWKLVDGTTKRPRQLAYQGVCT